MRHDTRYTLTEAGRQHLEHLRREGRVGRPADVPVCGRIGGDGIIVWADGEAPHVELERPPLEVVK